MRAAGAGNLLAAEPRLGKGNLGIVKALLDKGADVNIEDIDHGADGADVRCRRR